MPRFLVLAVALFSLSHTTRADETITPETVDAVKKASVFIRLEAGDWGATGSGFVVSGDDKALLIATNDHVASAQPPAGKAATLTVVFDSGTKAERSYTAQIVAADAERDLAVLRVTGVKNPPRPIAYAGTPKPVETMGVYTFGFPFGKALSTANASPAITVGKASVSSLREGPDGELAVVQIDGSLNPGNSGGPVVDAKGRLVGVAVATLRDGQGIGFAVPARELERLMQGRVGRVRVSSRKGADGAVTVRIEADLLDPAERFRGVSAHYVLVAPKDKKPETEALDKHPGSKRLALKVEKGVAAAEFTVPAAEGSVLVQVAADGGAGKVAVSSRVRALSLAPPPKAADLLGKPLPGWKEYSPRDNTFVMWVPEKPEQQEEEERNGTIDGQRMRVNSVSGKTAAGLAYEAESILLPLSFAKLPKKDALELFRGAVVKATGGRVTESKDAAVGTLSGAEYVIEARGTVTRAKIYVAGSRVYIVRVSGAPDQVSGAEAETLLLSYRLPGTTAVAKGPNDTAVMPKGGDTTVAPKGGDTAVTPKAKDPVILGHPNDPVFRDVAPAGGYLIGLEVGLGKFGPNDVIHSLRPIYRTGDKESQGERRGLETPRTVVVKAKPGYAVATVTVRAGLGLDGLSVTFMKVDGAQLDPKESYVSEWVGGPGGRAPVKLGGDGTPIVGIVGRTNGTVTNGFGVLLKGQEGFGVKKEPTVIAGGNNPLFKDVAPEGGLLIGLELGLGKFGRDDVIQAGRPIYRVGNKEQLGAQRGTNLVRVVTIKAKDGYAVGALTCKFGLNFDGCSLTFMKVKADGTLDPKDSYESEWVGYAGPKRPVKIPGDGTPVVGLAGRATGTQLHGLGLLFKGQEGFEVGSNPGGAAGNVITGGKEPYILGSIEHDPKFKTVGPAGAILVGLEVRFGKFGAIDIARAVRPIYRVNGKEEFGKQFGNDLTGSVTLRAKEGYAVGGITGKAGWWCNGFSLTFMKVKADGTLDPKDSYESEWVGFNGKGEVTRVLTDGAPAVGIVGKIVGTETTALGLLFKGQEDFDPDAKKK